MAPVLRDRSIWIQYGLKQLIRGQGFHFRLVSVSVTEFQTRSSAVSGASGKLLDPEGCSIWLPLSLVCYNNRCKRDDDVEEAMW